MILVDTGPIVALINDRDDRHHECRTLLERLSGPLLPAVDGWWRALAWATDDAEIVIGGRRDPVLHRGPGAYDLTEPRIAQQLAQSAL